MTTLDRETIEEAARSAIGGIRRRADDLGNARLDGLRNEYEQLVETLQDQYGHTRESARAEIVDFLRDLEEIDPQLPEIVADATAEVTGRKRRTPLLWLGLLLAVVAFIVAVARLRGSGTYRSF